jgi:hypothetical protein
MQTTAKNRFKKLYSVSKTAASRMSINATLNLPLDIIHILGIILLVNLLVVLVLVS